MSRWVARLSTQQFREAARTDLRQVELGVAGLCASAGGLAATLPGLVGGLVAVAGGVEVPAAPDDEVLRRLIRHRAVVAGSEVGRFSDGVTVLAEGVWAIDSASARATAALLRVHHSPRSLSRISGGSTTPFWGCSVWTR